MRLTLLYCPELNIYRLSNVENGREKTLTRADIDAGGPIWAAWGKMCRDNPNTAIEYQKE